MTRFPLPQTIVVTDNLSSRPKGVPATPARLADLLSRNRRHMITEPFILAGLVLSALLIAVPLF